MREDAFFHVAGDVLGTERVAWMRVILTGHTPLGADFPERFAIIVGSYHAGRGTWRVTNAGVELGFPVEWVVSGATADQFFFHFSQQELISRAMKLADSYAIAKRRIRAETERVKLHPPKDKPTRFLVEPEWPMIHLDPVTGEPLYPLQPRAPARHEVGEPIRLEVKIPPMDHNLVAQIRKATEQVTRGITDGFNRAVGEHEVGRVTFDPDTTEADRPAIVERKSPATQE